MGKIYSHTTALCPECEAKITARIIEHENSIYMEKFCPEHGDSKVLISSDVSWYEKSLSYIKPSQEPLKKNVTEFKGCPDSCGFCPEHQQHTCLPIIEINSNCDMDCPVCLKDFKQDFQLSAEDFTGIIKNLFATEGSMDVINISGGEPTLHPQLTELITIAKQLGVEQITVSTNGLTLLKDKKLRDFFRNNNVIAALQFDGFSSDTYKFIRGEDFAAKKMEMIKIFEEEGVSYSLVTTVVKGVNDSELTDITNFFFNSKALTIMFQPLAFTGSATNIDESKHRITTADIVSAVEQADNVEQGDINPLPCSHYSCFSLAYYFILENKRFLSMKKFFGEGQYLKIIENKTLPDLDKVDHNEINTKIYDMWSDAGFCACSLSDDMLKKIRQIMVSINEDGLSKQSKMELGKQNMKAIYIHDFMDKYTMDFARLQRCCNPYAQAGDKLVPMCSQNVFY